jgi:hypothetical protein
MKQLLIRVCFCWKIYYSKIQGCQTPEISSIYLYFKGLKDPKLSVPGGNSENVKPFSIELFENREIFQRIALLAQKEGFFDSSIF